MVNRRDFLRYGGIGLAGSALGVSFPTPSQAWVQIALAAAAVVAGQVAAHNRRDVSGIYLQRILGEISILANQVAMIQEGLATVIDQLNSLTERIEKQYSVQAQIQIKVSLEEFQKETAAQLHSDDLETWLSRGDRVERIKQIRRDLARSISQLMVSPSGRTPSCALVQSEAMISDINSLILCNVVKPSFEREYILNQIDLYEREIEAVLNPKIDDTTAWWLERWRQGKEASRISIENDPFFKELTSGPALRCYRANTFTPGDFTILDGTFPLYDETTNSLYWDRYEKTFYLVNYMPVISQEFSLRLDAIAREIDYKERIQFHRVSVNRTTVVDRTSYEDKRVPITKEPEFARCTAVKLSTIFQQPDKHFSALATAIGGAADEPKRANPDYDDSLPEYRRLKALLTTDNDLIAKIAIAERAIDAITSTKKHLLVLRERI